MKTFNKSITEEKERGRFYTPDYIVDNILNLAGYTGTKILKKHVIDNSCGDGAFLCKIVERYCLEAINDKYNVTDIAKDLSQYIHGIEIDSEEHSKCIKNVSSVVKSFGIESVDWDIICGDSMKISKYDRKMDFVLGNPPYVRVHNLGDSFETAKKFSFAQSGMTDLYIVFFEIGINMLTERGVLGYITPSSYFNSIAGRYLREYLINENLIKSVLDLKHFQAFDATTYTAVTILNKGKQNNDVDYYQFDEKNLIPYYVDTLKNQQFYIADNYYFAKSEDINSIERIFQNIGKSDVAVKNGYATLCDNVFINDFDFDSKFIIPVVKASKGIWKKIIFPYDQNSNLIEETELEKDEKLYKYLLDNKRFLLKRSNENDKKYWYAYGRSQAINDTFKDKLAINTLIRDENDLKFVEAPPGCGVYGGLYIISESLKFSEIIKALKTKEFVSYIAGLGKYKSGGYYTFSSKDVKKFLDYVFEYDGGLYVK